MLFSQSVTEATKTMPQGCEKRTRTDMNLHSLNQGNCRNMCKKEHPSGIHIPQKTMTRKVYKILCLDCNEAYIGETGKPTQSQSRRTQKGCQTGALRQISSSPTCTQHTSPNKLGGCENAK